MSDDTPMMRQYSAIKAEYPSMILFFRLGDFYEMFNQDAAEVSRLLNLTLTKRQTVPMCGIPYHAATNYIARLLRLGKRIAICEQVSEPGQKGIVDRKVTRIITPGTVVEDEYLEKERNNYLMGICKIGQRIHAACADISTAEFFILDLSDGAEEEELRRELYRLSVREILVQESLIEESDWLPRLFDSMDQTVVNRMPDWSFDRYSGYQRLLKHFGVVNLNAFGLEENDPHCGAAGAVLDYLSETSGSLIPQITHLSVNGQDGFMGIDDSSARNLEIVRSLNDGSSRFTLFDTLDFTKTGMGSRRLLRRLMSPLTDCAEIGRRLDCVEYFYRNPVILTKIQNILSRVLDLERLTTRLQMEKSHPKDIVSIRSTVVFSQELHTAICDSGLYFLPDHSDIERLSGLKELIFNALEEDPPLSLSDGGIIRKGYNTELDRLRSLQDNALKILDAYLEEEKANTGITNLKIKYNRIIGYYIEVSKGRLENVPTHFMRKQSLLNAERYTTEKLSGIEEELTSASEKTLELEQKLFVELRMELKAWSQELNRLCAFLGDLDFFQSLAASASLYGYVRPEVSETADLEIRAGRHPVVEKHLSNEVFVPNDTVITGFVRPFHLITGPNMAGKSTYLRQTALIAVMAQCGSFVPAQEAKIGIVDRLFCRVGASDNLARGQSTFLVEMSETALILRRATARSLVIMDEVGRGTGTIDGLSIAWAVSSHLMGQIRCRTLFATHYHELTAMNPEMMENYSLSVEEKRGKIIFLRKIVDGPSSQSFGIHVAQIAGIPKEVIEEAKRIMDHLKGLVVEPVNIGTVLAPVQTSLFPAQEMVITELAGLKLDEVNGIKALNLLDRWKTMLKESGD